MQDSILGHHVIMGIYLPMANPMSVSSMKLHGDLHTAQNQA